MSKILEVRDAIAHGIRRMNEELYGSWEIPEELIMERANNIASTLVFLVYEAEAEQE